MSDRPLRVLTPDGVVAILRQRWKTVLVGVVGALSIAAVLALVMRPMYSATAVVTVAPVTVDPFGDNQYSRVVDMESERNTALSETVADRAARDLGTSVSAVDLRDALKVTIPANSLVLSMTVTTQDEQAATAWANALAKAYLNDRQSNAGEVAARIAARLQSEIDAKAAGWAKLSPSEKTQTSQAMAALRERVSALSVVGLNPGRLVTRAQPPATESSLSTKAILVTGLAVGLLLGGFLALVRDRFDRRVGSAMWVSDLLGGCPVRLASPQALATHARRLVLMARRSPGRWPDSSVPTGGPAQLVVVTDGGSQPAFIDALRTELAASSATIASSSRAGAEPIGHGLGTTHGPAGGMIELRQVTSMSDLAAVAPRLTPSDVIVLEVTPEVGLEYLQDTAQLLGAVDRGIDEVLVHRRPDHPLMLPGPARAARVGAGHPAPRRRRPFAQAERSS